MARLAVDATAVVPGAKGIGRVAAGVVEALSASGIDVVALVQAGADVAAPTEVVRARPAVVWEQVGLAAAARRHERVLTFTERLPLVRRGRFAVWLFELPTHRLRQYRRVGAGRYERASNLVTAMLWKRSLRRAELVLAGSQATARELRSALPELRPVTVVHPGLSSRFSPGDGSVSDDRYVLHLGSADPRDNTQAVIEAFGRARASSRLPVRLVVAGGARMPKTSEVASLGRVSDAELVRLYRGASAFVDASLYEGFGYGPLEAMACGAPVVALDTPAVREVVGEAGLLCDRRDAGALARALVRVLDEPALADDLRARGIARAREFTWDGAAGALIDALELG